MTRTLADMTPEGRKMSAVAEVMMSNREVFVLNKRELDGLIEAFRYGRGAFSLESEGSTWYISMSQIVWVSVKDKDQ